MLARERVFQRSVQLRSFTFFATCQLFDIIPSSNDVVQVCILVFAMAFDQSQMNFLCHHAYQKHSHLKVRISKP
jgi:hypothetical protein